MQSLGESIAPTENTEGAAHAADSHDPPSHRLLGTRQSAFDLACAIARDDERDSSWSMSSRNG